MSRREYMRAYQCARRAADPERARAENRAAYESRKSREALDPALRERREALARAWADAHLEERARAQRAYYDRIRSTKEGLEGQRRRSRWYQERYKLNPANLEKLQARWAASKALQRGTLVRWPCAVCGARKVEMHHPDYAQPLAVRWLCKAHHEAEHVRQKSSQENP